jgi:hypothetical protein
MRGSVLKVVVAACAAAALAACSGNKESKTGFRSGDVEDGPFGGLSFGGGKKENPSGIGVNSFLWRATLDTLNFMPLASADPFGGVIITDWYSNPNVPGERFKLTVYILDTRLRADGIKVNVFKQTNASGAWTDATADPQTGIDVEDAILTRARQLRIATLKG